MIITSNTEVSITMTEEEASHLLEIIQHVGGSPRGPRGTFDQINDGLEKAGIKRSHVPNSPAVSGDITINKSNQT